jgi:hypothetical protein
MDERVPVETRLALHGVAESLIADPRAPREGEFWNAPFGALRGADELPDVAAFFAEGRERLG